MELQSHFHHSAEHEIPLGVGLAATSPQTVVWCANRLELFNRWIGDKLLSDLLETDLWDWYGYLNSRVNHGPGPVPGKISVFTQHGYLRAVRRFFKWLYERQIMSVNLARDLKLPRLPKNGEKRHLCYGYSPGRYGPLLSRPPGTENLTLRHSGY